MNRYRPQPASIRNFCSRLTLFATLLVAAATFPCALRAQEKPLMEIGHDCQVFAVSTSSKIVCAVPQLKRMKKVTIQRADIYVASPNGKDREIVEGEKFMPVPPAQSYIVNALSWSPDG
ncbi:MAG: hypothetical protein ACRD4E_08575, partial [Bryobacteraceae bacterium]